MKKTVQITCVKCGEFFQCEGLSFIPQRDHCYHCKPTRVTKRTTRRGCPRCGKLFDIDPKRPTLKQCPSCRAKLAELKEQNRINGR